MAVSLPRVAANDTDLIELLDYYDPLFDSAESMLLVDFHSPGYHTQLESGVKVHPTRESLTYALALLIRNRCGDSERASEILSRVLRLQDRDSRSKTYGTWPWHIEEPLELMTSPDMNWADFCGASLGQILACHREQLPLELVDEVKKGLRHATTSIQNRNVGAEYTNIAVLGGGVCAIAGETLGDDDLLKYGRERLRSVIDHANEHGGFSEYNSPPYSEVVIVECERILQVVRDEPTRKAAEAIRKIAWQAIAESFHPATQQWAGPHSRNSKIHLRDRTVAFLYRRIGLTLGSHPTEQEKEPRLFAVVKALDCPAEYLCYFHEPIADARTVKRTFLRRKNENDSRFGVTWLSPQACLGSVNQSGFWTQRKPLIGYWKTERDPAIAFRCRFLHDEKDFASMGIRSVQNGSAVLSSIHSLSNRGDWHRSLDRTADGFFSATDLRLRYELRGVGVSGEDLGHRRFALIAGEHKVVIHTLPGSFVGQKVVWQMGQGEDFVFVDAVCYRGTERDFDFGNPIEIQLAAGVELLSKDDPTSESPLRDGSGVIWESHALVIEEE